MVLLQTLRRAVLSSVRVPPNLSLAQQQAAAPLSLQSWRGFADASYLNKSEVTDRVLGVVKNFEKVDAGKVRPLLGWSGPGPVKDDTQAAANRRWAPGRKVDGRRRQAAALPAACVFAAGLTVKQRWCCLMITQGLSRVAFSILVGPCVRSGRCSLLTLALAVHRPQVSATAAFQKDLGLDSLDTVELVMALEEEFAIEIPDSEADKIQSCGDAISYISSNPMAK